MSDTNKVSSLNDRVWLWFVDWNSSITVLSRVLVAAGWGGAEVVTGGKMKHTQYWSLVLIMMEANIHGWMPSLSV